METYVIYELIRQKREKIAKTSIILNKIQAQNQPLF